MVTITLEENDAKYLGAVMASWRNEYEEASDHMSLMLQDLEEGLEPEKKWGLAPEEKWDEPTIIRHLKANDEAIEVINKVLDQIGTPTVL